MEIITKRPEGMSDKEYRQKRKYFTNWQRERRKHGVLVYMASQIVENEFGEGKDKHKVKRYQTFMPAIRTFDRYGNLIYKPMRRVELK